MPDLNESDLIAHTRRLARSAPSPDASKRAVAATLAALQSHQSRPTPAPFRWRNPLLLTSALAALLALAFALPALLPPQRADAATLLLQIADASRHYTGWVRIRSAVTSPTGHPVDLDSLTSYFDTATGAAAYEARVNSVRHLSLSLPATQENHQYNDADKEIVIHDVAPLYASARADHVRNAPLTIATAVDREKRRPGRAPTVTQRHEDNLLRIDVTFPHPPTTAPAPTTAPTTTPTFPLPSHATFWADPHSNLLRKTRYVETDGTTESADYTYDLPPILSLHDLGVPRTARTVDKRPKGQLAALLARLEQRAARGFGDGIVMLAEGRSTLHVSLRQNNSIFTAQYNLAEPRSNPDPDLHEVPRPNNWPNPTPDDLLAAITGATPMLSVLSHPNGDDMAIYMQAQYNIPNRLWPTRLSLRITGAADWQLLTDPARPGLVALHIVRTAQSGDLKIYRENTFWLDPARDDIPVEHLETMQFNGNPTRNRTLYSDPRQTPTGQWYPSRWRSYPMYDPTDEDPPFRESHLHVFPNHPIPPSWFQGPSLRIADRPITLPTKPTPPAP